MSSGKILACLCAFLFPFIVICQVPQKHFNPDSVSPDFLNKLKKEYGNKKKYPPQLEKQILVALSYYPELKNTPIVFRTRPQHSPGFTRVTWGGLFEPPPGRHFLVVISDSTEEMLTPLIFKNLTFNAQLGLMGHELAHISDFLTKTTLQIMKHVVCNVSAGYIDRFEYNTDAICIAHGLGYQLLEWSNYVRKKMNTINWRGPDYVHRLQRKERYMNPSTIIKKINETGLYQQ